MASRRVRAPFTMSPKITASLKSLFRPKLASLSAVLLVWFASSTFTFRSLADEPLPATINETFRQAAAGVGAILVPVGTGRPAAVNTIGQSQMYISDGSHPSQPGAYFSALTFYRTISRLSTTGLAKISGVSQTQADQAQAAANGVALAPTVAPTFNLAMGTYGGAQRIRLNTVTPRPSRAMPST